MDEDRALEELHRLEDETRDELDRLAAMSGARRYMEPVVEALQDVIDADGLEEMIAAYRHALQLTRHARRALASE